MAALGDALLRVYAGRTDVYGQQMVSVTLNEETGRPEKDVSWTAIKAPLTEVVLNAHLAGTRTVGVYLLAQDNSCRFVVWDFDGQDRNAVLLMRRALAEWEIDTLLFDSGRKGYHLVAVFDAAAPGSEAYALTRALWEQAGRPNKVECFPKQSMLSPNEPYGNLIKLPLGIHRATGRRCVMLDSEFTPVIEGTEIEELVALRPISAETRATLAKNFRGELPLHRNGSANTSTTASGFVHVPYPCFEDLSTAAYREGERNSLLFTLTKHLVNQGQPHAFVEAVVRMAAERCTDITGQHAKPYAEWQGIVESVYAHHYTSFGCETPEMQQFCKGLVCPIYQRDMPAAIQTPAATAEADENRIVRLTNLVQVGLKDPEFEVEVNGRFIRGVDAETFDSWPRFRREVMVNIGFVPELPRVRGEKPDDIWHALINVALQNRVLEERPDNAGTDAEVVQAALEYLTRSITVSERHEDIVGGAAFDDPDEEGITWRYFIGSYMLTAVRMRANNTTQRVLYNILRRRGLQAAYVWLDGKTRRLWRIPVSVLEETDW